MTDLQSTLQWIVWSEIKASGRTQSSICAAAGVSEKHLSQFVTGKAGMSLNKIDDVLSELDREIVVGVRVKILESGATDG